MLEQIIFFSSGAEQSNAMNLYAAGEADVVSNHSVPFTWVDKLSSMKDYISAPEAQITYLTINNTKPPMDDRRVRAAFNLSIDKMALAEWRKVARPLTTLTPADIFVGYPRPQDVAFDPERARQLLAEAGFRDAAGNYDPQKFPVDQVELTYNPSGSNRAIVEFVQAQLKQNLGLTIPLKSIEFRTLLSIRYRLEYKGFSLSFYTLEYMDPFTLLSIFAEDNGTGWSDPKYIQMLNEANFMVDHEKRYELLAKAEAYLLGEQPIIPLMTGRSNWLKKPYVKGLYSNPRALPIWKFVYIDAHPENWGID